MDSGWMSNLLFFTCRSPLFEFLNLHDKLISPNSPNWVQNLWVWCGTNCTKMQNWDFNSTLGLPEATIISLRMHEMHGWSTFSLSIGGSFKKFHLDPNSLELALLKNRFQAVSKPTYCMDVTVCVFLSPISVTFMLFFSAAYTFVVC